MLAVSRFPDGYPSTSRGNVNFDQPALCRCITRPRRAKRQDRGIGRAFGDVRPRQVAEAHQNLVDDEATGEAEGPAEQRCPVVERARMMRLEPGVEGAM